MGCCFSRPTGPNAPYPGGVPPSSSARAINPPSSRQQRTTSAAAAAAEDSSSSPRSPSAAPVSPGAILARRRSRAQQQQQPLDQHIDRPLRRHVWYATDRAWTRAQLDREREAFFDTRVAGRAEVWQTLHAALGVMWEADLKVARGGGARPTDDDEEDDVVEHEDDRADGSSDADESGDERSVAMATAQSILTAAEITLPTGDLASGVYDALGHYYALPEWIVCDPVHVAEDQQQQQRQPKTETLGDQKVGLGIGEDEDSDDSAALRRREDKGKAIDMSGLKDLVKIRARLSETARDVIVKVALDDSVRMVAEEILALSRLDPQTKRIKLVYLGKILKDNASLEAQGFRKEHIINAFVFSR